MQRLYIAEVIRLNIIIYNKKDHFTIKTIYNKSIMFRDCNIIRAKEYEELKYKLTLCFAGECVLIFYISEEKDMSFLESMKKYFIDIKLIIYLTFQNSDISSRAYAMHPRMVVNNGSSKELLPAVIEKTARNLIRQLNNSS